MGLLSFLTSCFTGKSRSAPVTDKSMQKESIYNFSIKSLDGSQTIQLSDFKGKYMVLVNTASECGYTPQYEDLQKFHEQYGDSIVLIGFPCNQFGGQEPGTAEAIQNFCQKNYGVNFRMTEKIDVKGESAHPIYKWLCSASLNGSSDFEVKWNFNKFVVGPDGQLLHYFGSSVKPLDDEFLAVFGK